MGFMSGSGIAGVYRFIGRLPKGGQKGSQAALARPRRPGLIKFLGNELLGLIDDGGDLAVLF